MTFEEKADEMLSFILEYSRNTDYRIPSTILHSKFAWQDNANYSGQSVQRFLDNEIINKDQSNYILTERFELFFRNLPSEYVNKPYSYFIHDRQQKEFVTEEKMKLEIEKLRNEYFDYPKVRREARCGLVIAFVAAIAAIVSIGIECSKR